MPAAFRHTLSALGAESRRRRRSVLLFALVVAFLGIWLTWFFLARVPVYEVSEWARIQATGDVHPIDAHVAGHVVSVHLPVGGRVKAGDVLLQLDPTDTRLRLEQLRTKERGLTSRLAALDDEITALQQALSRAREVGEASLSEAQALRAESNAAARLAARQDARVEEMHKAGVIADAEHEQAGANLLQSRARLTARDKRIRVLMAENRRDLAEREAEIAGLARLRAELRGQLDDIAIQIARTEVEQNLHTVRAPVAGRLGQVRAPRVGSEVEVGQTIAELTPDGQLEIAADFRPRSAIGRIRLGQPALMRVSGFPWTQYGVVHASVSAISGEIHDGRVRVILTIEDDEHTAIPIGHGLTGVVEVEREVVSPAILILRASGRFLAGESD